MRYIKQLTLTLSLFLFLTASSVFAEQLGNRTACPMRMDVAWGMPGCVVTGSFSTVVAPFSTVVIPMPVGNIILASRGYYIGTSCIFYVGEPCSGYPFIDNVVCGVACGNYTARLSNWGVVAYQP